jgi:penicillin G amidase
MEFTFNDEFTKYNATGAPQVVVLEKLMKEDEGSHWFDNVSTVGIETRNETMLLALNATINWLTGFYHSGDPSSWKWGIIHKIYFPHLTGLAPLSKGPYPGNGEGFTINPAGANLRDAQHIRYAQHGASERMILDFSNLNRSLSVIPSGERGLSNSKHYSDQLEQLFLQGKYHFQYYSNTPVNFPTNSIESTIYFLPR